MEKAAACVRSGFCCKAAPCPFGKWNAAKTQCEHLKGPGLGRYSCGIYDEIILEPAAAGFGPAFGLGCVSPLNTDRRLVHLMATGSIRNEDWPR